MIERRKYPRIKFEYGVVIICDTSSHLEFTARSGNLSEGSMLVLITRELLVGEDVTIKFNQPGVKNVSFSINGTIMRVSPKEDLFITGIRFFALDAQQKNLLQKFIKAHL